MKRQLISLDENEIPAQFRQLVQNANVYDSSCSRNAKVYYIKKDCGYFLKKSAKSSLKEEAEMTKYFHSLDLSPKLIAYESLDSDWMLTEKVDGEDCTHFLDKPEKVARILGEQMNVLHSLSPALCPTKNKMEAYVETVEKSISCNRFDKDLLQDEFNIPTADEAYKIYKENKHLLASDTLIHGDHCLPNVMLKDMKFKAYIDVGHGGIGDKHIDIFWALWSLKYNLKTNRYASDFLDAYGKSSYNKDALRLIAACEVFG